jgi:hypothetical protein
VSASESMGHQPALAGGYGNLSGWSQAERTGASAAGKTEVMKSGRSVGAKKVGGKPEFFVRYGSETEALASKESSSLVQKIQNDKPSNGSKWISERGKQRNPKDLGKKENYTHQMIIEARPGAKQWLQSKGINFEEMIGGESKNMDNVILKQSTEEGSYGIGANLLEEFNKNWVTKIDTQKIKR